MMVNAFTIDVEDYYHVSAFEQYIPRNKWDCMESRIEVNVDKILKFLSEHDVKATFFTLGWLAQKFPLMIRKIVDEGHELASHGYSHSRVYDMTRTTFLEDVARAKKLLEDTGGIAVEGFRAPSFSINENCWWAFECLRDVGYTYSSSIYPISHDHYGMPNASRTSFQPLSGLTEIPISTVQFRGRNYPSSGGGYFRLIPYSVSKWAFRRLNEVDGMPIVFYFHPWEIDPSQPRVEGVGAKAKFRHYVNLDKNEKKIVRLLSDFAWGTMKDVFRTSLHPI